MQAHIWATRWPDWFLQAHNGIFVFFTWGKSSDTSGLPTTESQTGSPCPDLSGAHSLNAKSPSRAISHKNHLEFSVLRLHSENWLNYDIGLGSYKLTSMSIEEWLDPKQGYWVWSCIPRNLDVPWCCILQKCRSKGAEKEVWPQEWTELQSEWGIHNTGKENALFQSSQSLTITDVLDSSS